MEIKVNIKHFSGFDKQEKHFIFIIKIHQGIQLKLEIMINIRYLLVLKYQFRMIEGFSKVLI